MHTYVLNSTPPSMKQLFHSNGRHSMCERERNCPVVGARKYLNIYICNIFLRHSEFSYLIVGFLRVRPHGIIYWNIYFLLFTQTHIYPLMIWCVCVIVSISFLIFLFFYSCTILLVQFYFYNPKGTTEYFELRSMQLIIDIQIVKARLAEETTN